MNQFERESVAALWATIANVYGKDLQRPVLRTLVNSVDDLPAEDVMRVLENWPKVSKLARHPFPVEIREQIKPVETDDSLAREAVARIQQAVSKFGFYNGAEAKTFVGELGWSVVKRFGGWGPLCEDLGVGLDVLTFQAQARELAKAHLALSRAGTLGHAPALPEPQSSKGTAFPLTKIGNGMGSVIEMLQANSDTARSLSKMQNEGKGK